MEVPANIRPSEIRLKKDRRALEISFTDGHHATLTAEFLRVLSPSAEVQGHSPEQRKTIPGKVNVEIIKLDPVGNYAVRIHFDDMHSSGLFTWENLYSMSRNKDDMWAGYLADLKEKGLSRTA